VVGGGEDPDFQSSDSALLSSFSLSLFLFRNAILQVRDRPKEWSNARQG